MTSADFRNELFSASLVLKEMAEACIVPVCRRYSLSPQQFHILMVLEKNGTQSVGELSGQVGILRGNITGVCKKMEERKLIVRSRSPEDERVVLVTIKGDGFQLLQDMKAEFDQCYNRFLREESPETVEEILNGLDILCGLAHRLKKGTDKEKGIKI